MKLKFFKVALVTLMLAVCNFANAGLITASNDLTANYSNYNHVTFNELNFASNTLITNQFSSFGLEITSGLQYLVNSARTNFNGSGLYNYGTNPYITPFSFDFNSTVQAMGFYIVMNTGQNVTFEALLNGNVVESYNETWTNCCSTLLFRGFAGGTYDSIKVTMVNGSNGAMELDNVYFSKATTVTEPTSLAIFALGIVALTARRFRK